MGAPWSPWWTTSTRPPPTTASRTSPRCTPPSGAPTFPQDAVDEAAGLVRHVRVHLVPELHHPGVVGRRQAVLLSVARSAVSVAAESGWIFSRRLCAVQSRERTGRHLSSV